MLSMRRVIPGAFALTIIALGPGAHTQTSTSESVWTSAAQLCVREINARAGCAACGGEWPQWTRCINAKLHYPLPKQQLDACIQQIWHRRLVEKTCAMCGYPTKEAWLCAGGR